MTIRERKSNASKAQRGTKYTKILDAPENDEKKAPEVLSESGMIYATPKKTQSYFLAKLCVTFITAVIRFYDIGFPSQVVFDEVHFGKFASYYLERTFFFDVHPPLGKLMFAFVGWLVGYDGSFKFDSIGDDYISRNVPYVALRSFSAIMGTLTVPLMFGTLENCGFSVAACVFGSLLVALDTAHLCETRLILLDAMLIFSIALSMFCYTKFVQYRTRSFSCCWWLWLFATGFSLSLVLSVKYVGVFTFLTVGFAVIWDLRRLLDIRSGLTLRQWSGHFLARALALIVFPLSCFLFWFWIHFQILKYSGPGDEFMSPAFQATLENSPVAGNALNVHFYDIVTIRSKQGKAFLHSHIERYPLRYDDGRISSQGQQVTGYSHDDINNYWQIVPALDLPENDREGHAIIGDQRIRLRHVATDSYLLTHDVASPGYPTNEEFTVIPASEALGERYNFTLFDLQLISKKNEQVRTYMSSFRLRHVMTPVVMWMSDKKLPEWGFGQFEINGNKDIGSQTAIWYFGDLPQVEDRESRKAITPDAPITKRSFIRNYIELQNIMFKSNNNLKSVHPYQSTPISWPFMVRGISFWTDKGENQEPDKSAQIYLVGNIPGWYIELAGLFLFGALLLIDHVALLRQESILKKHARRKLYNYVLWFYCAWALHYFPFFLMGRQLFLHHYLPAHMIGAILTAAVFDVFTGQQDKPNNGRAKKSTMIVMGSLTVLLILGFRFFMPLAYGYSLSIEDIKLREWFNISLYSAQAR